MEELLVITGGSRGIGDATARLAAQRGYSVGISYVRNREAAESVTEEIRRAGGEALAVRGDVSSEDDVASLFDTATTKL